MLRQRGQIVESTKSDVPFGVRAIQSGVQVYGIWISTTSTPIPSELIYKTTNGSLSSSFRPDASESNTNSDCQNRPSSLATPISYHSTQTVAPRLTGKVGGSAFVEHTDEHELLEALRNRQCYYPLKSYATLNGSDGNIAELGFTEWEVVKDHCIPVHHCEVDRGTGAIDDIDSFSLATSEVGTASLNISSRLKPASTRNMLAKALGAPIPANDSPTLTQASPTDLYLPFVSPPQNSSLRPKSGSKSTS